MTRFSYVQIVVLLLLCNLSQAQLDVNDSTTKMYALTIDDIINNEVSVATRIKVSLRETPSTVSVITREEILATGSRDLVDVLSLLVPGYNFGADVEGAVGVGFRGIWGHEGKILLLLDGLECNEEMFATTVFGNHYMVDNIEKIEVIRGPGSAIYGGYAGLSVINIITRGNNLNGGYFSSTVSQMSETYSHGNMSFGAGKNTGDLRASVTANFGQGTRSQLDNKDYYGNKMSMISNSDLDVFNLNGALSYKGLEFRLISDQYRTTQIDLWGENYTNGALKESFDTYFSQLSYTWKIKDKLELIPRVQYKRNYPWMLNTEDQEYTNNKYAEKISFNLTGMYKLNDKIHFLLGSEFYSNTLNMPQNFGIYEETFKNGLNQMGYKNLSVFGQTMIESSIVNLTLGGRYDNSDVYGANFVPRFCLTKIVDKFHVKGMASQSFRIPGGIIPNRIPEGVDGIRPEKATNFELETGYRLGSKSWLVLNAYSVGFSGVIIYAPDPILGVGTYQNLGKLGTNGMEGEYKYIGDKFNLSLNYAFYQVAKNDVASFVVPGKKDVFLAFPQNKANLIVGYKIVKNISINATASVIGKRYGYTSWDEVNEVDVLGEFDTQVVLNCNIRYQPFKDKGVVASVGLNNITDQNIPFIQPYQGSHAPLPSLSRAGVVRFEYKF